MSISPSLPDSPRREPFLTEPPYEIVDTLYRATFYGDWTPGFHYHRACGDDNVIYLSDSLVRRLSDKLEEEERELLDAVHALVDDEVRPFHHNHILNFLCECYDVALCAVCRRIILVYKTEARDRTTYSVPMDTVIAIINTAIRDVFGAQSAALLSACTPIVIAAKDTSIVASKALRSLFRSSHDD